MRKHLYRGSIRTLVDSCEADYLVLVTCQRCDAQKQMHPFTLLSNHRALTNARLGEPLSGFFCRSCRHKVQAVITCAYRRSGEM